MNTNPVIKLEKCSTEDRIQMLVERKPINRSHERGEQAEKLKSSRTEESSEGTNIRKDY